jgi:hypothetical protein
MSTDETHIWIYGETDPITTGKALVSEIIANTVIREPDPFTDPRESEAGPWFIAGFDGECDLGDCSGISEGDTIRANGSGGWECESCTEPVREPRSGYGFGYWDSDDQ